MIKAGIIGGAGYTAGELIRLLVNHPEVELTNIQSSSNSGKLISSVHNDLVGETDLKFSSTFDMDVDVLFLCSGHGKSKSFIEENSISDTTKVIDLSNDFRLKANADGFVYGLPEVNKPAIENSKRIANPGCFATAIQLALLPLADQQLLENELHVQAVTGSTGAGQAPSPTSHFSWRNNNLSVYKAFTHQHLDEITETIQQNQPTYEDHINFVPVRGCFSRGILATVYTDCNLYKKELNQVYNDYYSNHPFTIVSDEPIHLKQVVNTNKCLLHVEKHNGKAFITSVIDNLIKGASGQAIQNMNLLFGLEETAGLELKANYF